MRKYPIYRSKRNEYSLIHFSIRRKKDTCLYDDIENLFNKRNLSSNILVDMLINQSFSHARYTDHDYPL
jgi:hypothetical protein